MSNCSIIKDNKGNITDVKAPNGASSLLYQAALNITNSPEAALNVWAVSQTPMFVEDVLIPNRAQQEAVVQQKETAQFVVEYLKERGQNINVVPESQIIEEARKRGADINNLINIDGVQLGKSFTFKKSAQEIEQLAKTNSEININELFDLTPLTTLLNTTDLKETKIIFDYDSRANTEASAALEIQGDRIQSITINASQADFRGGAQQFRNELAILISHEAQHLYDRENGLDYGGSVATVEQQLQERQGDVYRNLTGNVVRGGQELISERQAVSVGIYLALRGEVRARRNSLEEIGVPQETVDLYEPIIPQNLILENESQIENLTEQDLQKYINIAVDYLYNTVSPTKDGLEYLRQGEKIYGFYDTNTKEIFLTEEVLTSENLVHELYHSFKPLLKDQKTNKTAQQVLKQIEELALQLLGGEQGIKNRFDSEGKTTRYHARENKLDFSNDTNQGGEIIHEIQHIIQKNEGFERGTSQQWSEQQVADTINTIRSTGQERAEQTGIRRAAEQILEQKGIGLGVLTDPEVSVEMLSSVISKSIYQNQIRLSVNNTQLSASVYNPRIGETFTEYRERLIEEAEAILLQQNSIQYFERIAKENGLNEKQTKTFIQKIQQFIKDFSNWIVDQLGITNVTPEQVAQMTQRELFDTITTSMLRGDFTTAIVRPSTKVKGYNQMSKGGATIHYKDGNIELIETDSKSRGQGAARLLLEEFVQIADQQGQTLNLMVAPREKGTTVSGLVALYKSVGFSFYRGSDFEMVRYPLKRKQPMDILDQNGEPKVNVVMDYIERTNAEDTPQISNTEKQDVRNILRSLKLTSSNEIVKELNKVFVNGQINMDALKENKLFTRAEVQSLTQENIDNLLTLKRQLENTEEITDTIDFIPEFVLTTRNKNKYGKMETTNPLVIEQEIAKEVAGIENRQDFDNAFTELEYPSIVDKYLSDENFAQEMYIRFSTMKQLSKHNIQGEELVEAIEPNRATEIEHTLSFQEVDFKDDVQGLLMVTEDIWDNSQQEVETILRSVERKGIKAGIDLEGLAMSYENRTKAEIMALLTALNNVNVTQTQEALDEFIAVYKDFFDVVDTQDTTAIEMRVEDTNKSLIYVENELSEYEMFNRHSLVKVDNNIYQRVNKVSNENLIQILYLNAITENNRVLPNTAYFNRPEFNGQFLVDPQNKQTVLDNIKRFAENNIHQLNLEESSFDSDVAQQLLLYKFYYNNPLNIQPENNYYRDTELLKTFDGDIMYLSTDYLHDFQVKKLQEREKDSEVYNRFYSKFHITEKGLQLNNTDIITKQDIQDSLEMLNEKEQKDFKNYVAISKDTNIKELFENVSLSPNKDSYRDLERRYYQNNPKALPLFKGQYTNFSGGVISSETATSTFLRVRDKLYEKTDGNSSETYYSEIPTISGNFYTLLDQNTPNKIDNKDVAKKSETKIEHNRLYSKAEETQINQKNFDCN